MSFFKKGEWKLFYPIYLAMFIGIAVPDIDMLIIVFFFAKGFTATQIGIGLALCSLFTILSEVPTGAIADIYGKRISTQVCFLLFAIIFILFFFVTTPLMMWILYSFMGIATTFRSGAFDALPYEMAKRAKRTDLINPFYSTYGFLVQIASMLSNFAVIGFLFIVGATTKYIVLGQQHLGLDFLWLTGAVGYVVAFTILFWIKETNVKRKFSVKNDFKEMNKKSLDALNYSRKHPVIRRILISGIFFAIASLLFSDIVYQPFLLEMGTNPENIAIIIAAASLIGAWFSIVSRYLAKKFSSEKKYIEIIYFIKLMLLVSLYFFAGPLYSIIFFLVFFSIDCLIRPVIQPFKQFFYHSKMRATLGSVESLINSLVGIIVFPLIGYMVDNLGATATVMSAAIPLLIGFFIFWSIDYKKQLAY